MVIKYHTRNLSNMKTVPEGGISHIFKQAYMRNINMFIKKIYTEKKIFFKGFQKSGKQQNK